MSTACVPLCDWLGRSNCFYMWTAIFLAKVMDFELDWTESKQGFFWCGGRWQMSLKQKNKPKQNETKTLMNIKQ